MVKSKLVTPDELEKIGTEMFGEYWQRALANAIGRNEKLVRKWLGGQKVTTEDAVRIRELRTAPATIIAKAAIRARDISRLKARRIGVSAERDLREVWVLTRAKKLPTKR